MSKRLLSDHIRRSRMVVATTMKRKLNSRLVKENWMPKKDGGVFVVRKSISPRWICGGIWRINEEVMMVMEMARSLPQ